MAYRTPHNRAYNYTYSRNYPTTTSRTPNSTALQNPYPPSTQYNTPAYPPPPPAPQSTHHSTGPQHARTSYAPPPRTPHTFQQPPHNAGYAPIYRVTPTNPWEKSNHQMIKEGGWENQKEFMESHGLRLWNHEDFDEARELLDAYRRVDAWRFGFDGGEKDWSGDRPDADERDCDGDWGYERGVRGYGLASSQGGKERYEEQEEHAYSPTSTSTFQGNPYHFENMDQCRFSYDRSPREWYPGNEVQNHASESSEKGGREVVYFGHNDVVSSGFGDADGEWFGYDDDEYEHESFSTDSDTYEGSGYDNSLEDSGRGDFDDGLPGSEDRSLGFLDNESGGELEWFGDCDLVSAGDGDDGSDDGASCYADVGLGGDEYGDDDCGSEDIGDDGSGSDDDGDDDYGDDDWD
ncbi:hypothetical protein K491DRAFT_686694 [Lophiostoma macrostomum CBS 122681]|uniref:Uncharacterized protein n=1 Tax=Lophiostoma macrostomum CBS 122681 TaxID=1314788 RepID=A0A6A6TSD4_9PLEO|nr:hypothetical protein K491DRAFT_686694 [Lophiostoma macrostomum CBS 122681]